MSRRAIAVLGPLTVVFALAASACQSRLWDGTQGARGNDPIAMGHLGFALQVASGIDIDEVMYTITRSDGYLSQGSIPLVMSDATFRALLILPAETAYTLELQATTSEGAICNGHARFDIWPDKKTDVNVLMRCPGVQTLGTVDVNGIFNVCPFIDSVVATPEQAEVGATVGLYAGGSDQDGSSSALHYLWTTTSGTLDNDMAQMTFLRCTTPGVAVVRLTLSDGDTGCDVTSAAFDVTCTAAGATTVVDAGALVTQQTPAPMLQDAAIQSPDAGPVAPSQADSGPIDSGHVVTIDSGVDAGMQPGPVVDPESDAGF